MIRATSAAWPFPVRRCSLPSNEKKLRRCWAARKISLALSIPTVLSVGACTAGPGQLFGVHGRADWNRQIHPSPVGSSRSSRFRGFTVPSRGLFVKNRPEVCCSDAGARQDLMLDETVQGCIDGEASGSDAKFPVHHEWTVVVALPAVPEAANMVPGLRIPAESRARFTLCEISSRSSPIRSTSQGRLSRPTPCSLVMLPPSFMARSMASPQEPL